MAAFASARVPLVLLISLLILVAYSARELSSSLSLLDLGSWAASPSDGSADEELAVRDAEPGSSSSTSSEEGNVDAPSPLPIATPEPQLVEQGGGAVVESNELPAPSLVPAPPPPTPLPHPPTSGASGPPNPGLERCNGRNRWLRLWANRGAGGTLPPPAPCHPWCPASSASGIAGKTAPPAPTAPPPAPPVAPSNGPTRSPSPFPPIVFPWGARSPRSSKRLTGEAAR